MAAMGSGRGTMDSQNQVQSDTVDRLKLLYPNVNEDETPLPRSWSTKDKFSYIGLSQNNLRVHYKGYTSVFQPVVNPVDSSAGNTLNHQTVATLAPNLMSRLGLLSATNYASLRAPVVAWSQQHGSSSRNNSVQSSETLRNPLKS
ncbi:unnamed protein product [Plutella xylostella]|uniref:(diamondback moth) hypothetical protein n=1 Tax=Plutella xylostella TaxID=51655 RepID=A0A8S4GBI5_PLUXY|nr:unnamed protein product [Plutella xylostella]